MLVTLKSPLACTSPRVKPSSPSATATPSQLPPLVLTKDTTSSKALSSLLMVAFCRVPVSAVKVAAPRTLRAVPLLCVTPPFRPVPRVTLLKLPPTVVLPKVVLPDAVKFTWPNAEADVLMLASTRMFLPDTVKGPLRVMAVEIVTSTSAVPSAPAALPIVKPVRVVPKFHPKVLIAPLKSLPVGSMRNLPTPVKPEVPVVGAWLAKTSTPLLMAVLPP